MTPIEPQRPSRIPSAVRSYQARPDRLPLLAGENLRTSPACKHEITVRSSTQFIHKCYWIISSFTGEKRCPLAYLCPPEAITGVL